MHCQIWAALSGCIAGEDARRLLRKAFDMVSSGDLVTESDSMSFFALRALSLVGRDLYNERCHHLWKPWKDQLAMNLDTWFLAIFIYFLSCFLFSVIIAIKHSIAIDRSLR
jgi:hypothetical protein